MGWGIGIAVEAAFPWLMLGGGQAQLWTGLGAEGSQLAAAEAAATGGATISSTFIGSVAVPVLALAEKVGASGSFIISAWRYISANFVAGAGSATALVGPQADASKTFFTTELPSLVANGVSVAIRYVH